MGGRVPSVELWSEEGSGAFNSWREELELRRRKNGSFVLRARCRGIDDHYVTTLYCSRPFRTPERLLAEIDGKRERSQRQGFKCDFTLRETLLMLADLVDFDPSLAKGALRVLARDMGTSTRARQNSRV